jgi:hypothetical protein
MQSLYQDVARQSVMARSIEDICRQTILELDHSEHERPISPTQKLSQMDRTFAVRLTRIKERIAANKIIMWYRARLQRRKPTLNLMLRAIENNKIIKNEIQSLRKELEKARKQKELEAQAAALRDSLKPEFSPFRACRILLKEPLSSPASMEHLLRLLGTDPSAIRASLLDTTRTEIALIFCLTRCRPDDWQQILENLPNEFLKNSSFPEVLKDSTWAEEFAKATALPPVWVPPKPEIENDENEDQLNPTVRSFVDRLKGRVMIGREVDKDTMDAFGDLGRRRRRRRSESEPED